MIVQKILPMIVVSLLFLAPFSICHAEGDYGAGAVAGVAGIGKTVAGESSVEGLAGKVIALALSFVGIIFFLLILYAGFTWMTAMGNTEATSKSKEIIEAAIIGLVLVSAAYAISSFVFNRLGSGGGTATPAVTGIECKKMGDSCGNSYNMKCNIALACVSVCEIEFGGDKGGKCVVDTECTGFGQTTTTGKCPGAANIVCCHT